MATRREAQVPISFSKRGGARIGAGRKKKRDRGVPHAKRPELSGRTPLHVTVRVLPHVYNLRTRRCFEVVFAAMLACCSGLDFRIVALTVQGHHLHLMVEAASALALSRGMQGVMIRLAKGLNRVMGRKGPVFRERYHARALATPREVRATMAYILKNTRKHAAQVGRRLGPEIQDPYTVGYFGDRVLQPEGTKGMVAPPQTWLLGHGWRRGSGPALGEPHRVAAAPTPGLLSLLVRPPDTRPPEPSEHRDRPLALAEAA